MISNRLVALMTDTKFAGWNAVEKMCRDPVAGLGLPDHYLNAGQHAALAKLTRSFRNHGAVLADEVGLGKTRIAAALAEGVVRCGGRVAIAVPPIVAPQWAQELTEAGRRPRAMLRSLNELLIEAGDVGWTTRIADPLVILSHRFGDVRANGRNTSWRADLLKQMHARHSRGRDAASVDYRARVCAAAVRAQATSCATTNVVLDGIVADLGLRPRFGREKFGRDGPFQTALERAVGLAVGRFDLVIIDEAHKGRRSETKLSTLIETVLLWGPQTRRLGMTATPVELGVSQWRSILARVGVGSEVWERLEPSIHGYRDAVRDVRRRWGSDPAARERYASAASAFETALSPFLVRRDKRSDETVMAFRDRAGQHESHRRETCLEVELENLETDWCQAVFAAEALSAMGTASAGGRGVRARLTFGNGHGVAAMLDAHSGSDDEPLDEQQSKDDQEEASQGLIPAERQRAFLDAYDGEVPDAHEEKKHERAEWWRELMLSPLRREGASLYGHPAIVAAADAIDVYVAADEKVLVFGRFTRPMRALTELLNARALLRAVRDGTPWPQQSTSAHNSAALEAAAEHLGQGFERASVDAALEKSYKRFEQARDALRGTLFERIQRGLHAADETADLLVLLDQAKAQASEEVASGGVLLRAMDEVLQLGTADAEVTDRRLAEAFAQVVGALRERNEGDEDDNGLDEDEASRLWPKLYERLQEEYGTPRAAFARLLHGQTRPTTRRLVQLAFNRPNASPKVLVAQSLVGREGLNLHGACRVVLLLHLEWNPGVVEQQIGRVDRLDSHWERRFNAVPPEASTQALPRIEVRPVVFEGTYDERHWSVLSERWDDLRAQLHGVVVPGRDRTDPNVDLAIVAELDRMAPNFDPAIKDAKVP